MTDGVYVYWSDTSIGSIFRQDVALSGQLIVVQNGLGTSSYKINLAVDDTYVYWNDSFAEGGIGYARKDGTDVGMPETRLASGQPWPFGIATDGSHVYWSNEGSSPNFFNHPNSDGTIMRVVKP